MARLFVFTTSRMCVRGHSVGRHTGFYQLSCGVGTASRPRAEHTSAAGAHQTARFYIELTLFTQSDLERKVDKPSQYSDNPFITLGTRLRTVSLCLFLWNTRISCKDGRS